MRTCVAKAEFNGCSVWTTTAPLSTHVPIRHESRVRHVCLSSALWEAWREAPQGSR